ncbi:MAG: TRAP transporter small permease [Candidatus Eremiobacteraeota bacterium]|nr:TRAP transporter small permease [Candidatus Eremiobacteraeota bacterium]
MAAIAAAEKHATEIVSSSARHLKWRALDPLEYLLMCLSGICLLGFTVGELGDVLFRILLHPWLTAQEFSVGFFVWGAFLGGAVAVRRDTHFKISAVVEKMTGGRRKFFETFRRVIVAIVAIVMIVAGYINYLSGFGSFLTPSETPIAILYAAIPVSGALILLFTIESLVNGWRHGFEAADEPRGLQEILTQEALERGI